MTWTIDMGMVMAEPLIQPQSAEAATEIGATAPDLEVVNRRTRRALTLRESIEPLLPVALVLGCALVAHLLAGVWS